MFALLFVCVHHQMDGCVQACFFFVLILEPTILFFGLHRFRFLFLSQCCLICVFAFHALFLSVA